MEHLALEALGHLVGRRDMVVVLEVPDLQDGRGQYVIGMTIATESTP